MPLKKHYRGHGEEVMADMKKTYGSEKKAKEVFYSTENKMAKGKGSKRKGKNPFYGNSLPFALGEQAEWFKDSRGRGPTFMKKSKKGK